MSNYFIFIPLLPLIGFLFNGLLGKKINSEKISGIIGSATVLIPFLLSVYAFIELYGLPQESRQVVLNTLTG